ncbi:MAG: GDP-mannose 4,6-dehydratase [Actinomycetota bacterium]|nr:GDP-mannose 4,6-dehydratase [Actinomycetota bacterium]
MKNLLITGGAGFIGSSFIGRLLKSNYRGRIICLDDFNDYYSPAIKRSNIAEYRNYPNFLLYEADITDYESLVQLFKAHKIDKIVHLAARAGVRPSIEDPLLYGKVNVSGTLNLLQLACQYKIHKFIFASSSSVYGNNQKIPFAEQDNVDFPISPYAATKKSGELICYTYHHLYEMDCFCLRFFTVYGPRQRPEMAIHKFVDLIEKGKPIHMYGDGSTSRDYTFIDDITQALETCLDRLQGYQIFNLGNCHPITLKQLIRLIEQKLGKKAQIVPMEMQPGDVDITYADITKAKKWLDYNPATPIEEGIEKFITWYREKEN